MVLSCAQTHYRTAEVCRKIMALAFPLAELKPRLWWCDQIHSSICAHVVSNFKHPGNHPHHKSYFVIFLIGKALRYAIFSEFFCLFWICKFSKSPLDKNEGHTLLGHSIQNHSTYFSNTKEVQVVYWSNDIGRMAWPTVPKSICPPFSSSGFFQYYRYL